MLMLIIINNNISVVWHSQVGLVLFQNLITKLNNNVLAQILHLPLGMLRTLYCEAIGVLIAKW